MKLIHAYEIVKPVLVGGLLGSECVDKGVISEATDDEIKEWNTDYSDCGVYLPSKAAYCQRPGRWAVRLPGLALPQPYLICANHKNHAVDIHGGNC